MQAIEIARTSRPDQAFDIAIKGCTEFKTRKTTHQCMQPVGVPTNRSVFLLHRAIIGFVEVETKNVY